MYKVLTFAAIILLAFACCSKTNSTVTGGDWPSDSIRVIKKDLNYPWEILWGKDDHIWMTERGGKVNKIDPKTGNIIFTATLAGVVANGEGGLLGMAQHPDFLTNGLLYVVYNYDNAGSYREKMVQLKFTGTALELQKTIIDNIPASNIHNGARLLIAGDKLFMTTGDASNQPNAQNISSFSGKVLRYALDGSIPADNPVAGSPIWSLGHRNPQGLVMANGKLYASEHGPDVEDEINIIEKNRNYGWPTVTGPCNTSAEVSFCTTNNVKEPVWSSGPSTIATCGLDYYDNSRIAAWQKSLLMATLKDASLRVLKLSPDGLSITSQQTLFKNSYGRIRDICISPAGRVYLCTSNGGNADQLVEISGQ